MELAKLCVHVFVYSMCVYLRMLQVGVLSVCEQY